MYLTRCYLLILVIVVYQTVVNCLWEGEFCHHQRSNTNGVCKVLKDCPSAIQDSFAGEYPQNCGLQGNLVIVCCPQTGTTPPTTTTITTTSTTITTTTSLPPIIAPLPVGEKAKRACKEYEKLGHPPGINGDAGYDEVGNCPWKPALRSHDMSLVVIGTPSTLGEFPHMALVGYGTSDNYEYQCGGSLISDKFVLTAAHCLYTRLGEPQFVRLGDLNYTDPNDDQYVQQIKIKTLHKHPQFNIRMAYNDIALLELEKSATLHVYVKPACLQVNKFNYPEGIVSGWGYTEEEGEPSEHLLKATVERFTPKVCNKTYEYNKRMVPRGIDPIQQICYGSKTDSKDTCKGDSGGPLQVYADVYCSYYVFGITSFGKGCGREGIPAVYIRVSHYIEWIEGIVWPS